MAPPDNEGSLSSLYKELFSGQIEKLYSQSEMRGIDGGMHPVDMMTSIPRACGSLLWSLVKELRPTRTLETGFAYGVSSVFILGALESNGKGQHTAIDPYQNSIWNGIGTQNVRSLGMEKRFRCITEPSGLALAKALANNERFEMIFIDGDHLFDGVMVDIYYANRLLVPGGVMVLDDAPMRSLRAAISWVEANLPFHRIQTGLPVYTPGEGSGGVEGGPAQRFAVFQKQREDDRDWLHFEAFDGGGI